MLTYARSLTVFAALALTLAGCAPGRRGGRTGGAADSGTPRDSGSTTFDQGVLTGDDGGVITTPDATVQRDSGTTTCSDACSFGTTRCGSSTRVDECVEGENGCTEWLTVATCSGGNTCSGGECTTGTSPGFSFTVNTTAFPSGSARESALDTAGAASLRAQCACFYADVGYSSAGECESDVIEPRDSTYVTCLANAYDAASSSVKQFLSCTTRLDQQQTACVEASECESTAAAECFVDESAETAFGTAFDRCVSDTGTTETSYATYAAAVDACALGSTADNCNAGATASTRTGSAVFSGSTTGAGDHRKAPMECLPYAETVEDYNALVSPDVAHKWSAPSAGVYTFDTIGSAFDTVLYAVSSCSATPTADRCNDDDSSSSEVTSSLTLSLTAGETIYLVVDGFGASTHGRYVVNINAD